MGWKCGLLGHKWSSKWREFEHHLECDCLRCGYTKANFRSPEVVLIEAARDIILKFIEDKWGAKGRQGGR